MDAGNYYSQNPLNRLSYLRSSSGFLASALSSEKSRFVLFDALNPLCGPPGPDGIKLHTVNWSVVKEYIGDPDDVFKGVDGKDQNKEVKSEGKSTDLEKSADSGEKTAFWLADKAGKSSNRPGGHSADSLPVVAPSAGEGTSPSHEAEDARHHFMNQPPLVFLGVDERSAPESAKSLPLTKPDSSSTLASHSPHGIPYWALDVTTLTHLKEKVVEGNDNFEFVDMRASMSSIPGEEAALAAEGRALVDWNKRNIFCPACARPMRSVWAGWKRACVPSEKSASGLDSAPACISKKGVHNFNYPRTDPVVIMAILSPDKQQILLGRQKAWPRKFYSCLAGFIEAGETIEEAVRREVYEEAGVVVNEVYYHSSQPWPYPSSLMIGCIGVAAEGQTVRTDLDNELEDAHYFTKEDVLAVIGSGTQQLSRAEVSRFDGKEGRTTPTEKDEKAKEMKGSFRMPPDTAIANTLIQAWAKGTYTSGSAVGKL